LVNPFLRQEVSRSTRFPRVFHAPGCYAGKRKEPTMADERRYWAFLVRLWSVHHNGELVWRASAENAHTGEQHAFADMESLFDFLRAMVEKEPAVSGQKEEGCEENREMG
jgi:hypothetical protein